MAEQQNQQVQAVEQVSYAASFESTRKGSFESALFRSSSAYYAPAETEKVDKPEETKNEEVAEEQKPEEPTSDTKINNVAELQTKAPKLYQATLNAMMTTSIRQMNRFRKRMKAAWRRGRF